MSGRTVGGTRERTTVVGVCAVCSILWLILRGGPATRRAQQEGEEEVGQLCDPEVKARGDGVVPKQGDRFEG